MLESDSESVDSKIENSPALDIALEMKSQEDIVEEEENASM